ncbi:DUF1697 domain-containing protein [Cellulomonas sp. URHD0024]|uniref:DUF1697 domain-containing protein n=1 Tax=Cellulomonas sp. URHD0024 TaxID=1302620 RepID=UPI000486F340|nr:DUF1697 domain-containing protein [Cellulomonas sp. URHD0024]
MSPVIALLRAVNVGGRKVTSAQLRSVASSLGHTDVTTYVNSGNLVLVPAPGADVAAGLSAAFADEFGFDIPVIARTLEQWSSVVDGLPFTTEAADDPAHLVAVFWDGPVATTAGDFDPSRYGREVLVWADRETYAYYPDGQGRSKLTIDVLSRASGRVGTARNWNTVLALQRLARERA